MGKRKEIVESESEEDPESSFYVEVITKARVVEGNKFEYRVKWWSYPDSDNTWEPYENVKGCTRLLKSFWKEVGKDKRKNPGPVGEEYVASEKWIKAEKLIFQRDMEKNTDVDKSTDVIDLDQEEEEEEIKIKPAEVPRKQERKDQKPKEPVPSSSKAPPQAKAERSRTKVVHISDTDSEDDKPLKKKAKSEKTKPKQPVPEVSTSKRTDPLRFRKTSIASSATGNEDEHREAESSLSAPKKYSGLNFNKKPRRETNNANEKGDFSLKSAPPLTADEINVHRPKPAERPATEDINLLDSDVYGSLFLPSQSQQDVSAENGPPDMDAAENFLETISSRTAAAALKPSELAKAEAAKAAIPPPPRPIFKKWTWDGDLYLKFNEGHADKLCKVRYEDITDVSGEGFKFDTIMEEKDLIRFDRLYSMFEMRTMLRALRRVDQFASMCPSGPADREAFLAFKTFMRDKKLATRTPVITDFGHVAEMIMFPVESELSGLLSVPLSLSNHAVCIVALMPWAVPPSAYKPLGKYPSDKVERRSREEVEEWSSVLGPTRITSQLVDDLKLLAFPKWLIGMVRNNKYCVWARSVEQFPQESGRVFVGELRPETAALFNVLTALGAKNVGYKQDLIFVFVHVGAMDTLNSLEALPERRSKRPEVRFITYGRHSCVKPDLWGIREIYPLGGVVTFTAKALLEDPFGSAELIKNLHKHPMWLTYMLPSVLAVFVKFASMPSNPIEAYSTSPFKFGRILHLVHDGSIAVTESPPLVEQPRTALDPSPSDEWIVAQLKTLERGLVDIVEESWRIFISQFSNKSDDEIHAALEAKINEDLIRLQMQPSMRSTHRRYVVIKSLEEKHISCYKGGFEWETAASFKIRDDFFSKDQPLNHLQPKK